MVEYFKVGQIVNTQGLKGDMRVYPLTDYKERFEELEWVYMGNDRKTKYELEKVRYKNNLAIIKIKGIETANEVDSLRNEYLYIPRENARELGSDEHFISDLIGLNVYLTNGDFVGRLDSVIQTGANDVYSILTEDKKEILIPAIKKFVPKVDIKGNTVVIDPIEGML